MPLSVHDVRTPKSLHTPSHTRINCACPQHKAKVNARSPESRKSWQFYAACKEELPVANKGIQAWSPVLLKHALVPGEDQPGECRHVIWQEVCARHQVKRSTILGWKAKGDVILRITKYGRALKGPGVCAYPGMEKLLYEKFLVKRGSKNIIRRAWFQIASRYILRKHVQCACLIATSFGIQPAGFPCEWEPIQH